MNKGIICRQCHREIHWKDLLSKYDRHWITGAIIRVWSCPRCGSVVKSEELSTSAFKWT